MLVCSWIDKPVVPNPTNHVRLKGMKINLKVKRERFKAQQRNPDL